MAARKTKDVEHDEGTDQGLAEADSETSPSSADVFMTLQWLLERLYPAHAINHAQRDIERRYQPDQETAETLGLAIASIIGKRSGR